MSRGGGGAKGEGEGQAGFLPRVEPDQSQDPGIVSMPKSDV